MASASSARKSSRREPAHVHASGIARSDSDDAIHLSATSETMDCVASLAITAETSKEQENEAHLLTSLTIRPQGPHRRDRDRPDRQDRIHPGYRRTGYAE